MRLILSNCLHSIKSFVWLIISVLIKVARLRLYKKNNETDLRI